MNYILGLISLLVGVVLILKTEWFVENFGRIGWAEEHLGFEGGSRLMYKIIGLIFIFFGMLLITNLMSDFLMATVGRLFMLNR